MDFTMVWNLLIITNIEITQAIFYQRVSIHQPIKCNGITQEKESSEIQCILNCERNYMVPGMQDNRCGCLPKDCLSNEGMDGVSYASPTLIIFKKLNYSPQQSRKAVELKVDDVFL